MQKFLRVLIVLLLLLIAAAVVYTQTQLYATRHTVAHADISASKTAVPQPAPPSAPAFSAAPPAAAPATPGTEASPVVVRLLPVPESPDDAGERYKEREIQLAIEHNLRKMAAAALAQNFLMLFQAVIYFLTLLILFMLMENLKKFADAASRSADAARASAEAANAALADARKPGPRFFRRR